MRLAQKKRFQLIIIDKSPRHPNLLSLQLRPETSRAAEVKTLKSNSFQNIPVEWFKSLAHTLAWFYLIRLWECDKILETHRTTWAFCQKLSPTSLSRFPPTNRTLRTNIWNIWGSLMIIITWRTNSSSKVPTRCSAKSNWKRERLHITTNKKSLTKKGKWKMWKSSRKLTLMLTKSRSKSVNFATSQLASAWINSRKSRRPNYVWMMQCCSWEMLRNSSKVP